MDTNKGNEVIAILMGGKWDVVWHYGKETKVFNFPGWHIIEEMKKH